MSGQPLFSWTGVSHAVSYEIWITDLTTKQVQKVFGLTATSLNWPAAKALRPGDRFTWWVGAVSTNGLATVWDAGQDFIVAPLTAG